MAGDSGGLDAAIAPRPERSMAPLLLFRLNTQSASGMPLAVGLYVDATQGRLAVDAIRIAAQGLRCDGSSC